MASWDKNMEKDLLRYVAQGSWWDVIEMYGKYRESHKVKIPKSGDTALHVAVSDGQKFEVEEMVSIAGSKALAIGNDRGNTPLHLAASLGSSSICKCIAEKDSKLLRARNKDGETPLFVAVNRGRTDAFLCLRRFCKDERYEYAYYRRRNGDTILHSAISEQHFDLAYIIIREYPKLGGQVNEDGVSPLHLLASVPSVFPSGTHLTGIRKLLYHCICVRKLAQQKPDPVKAPNSKRLSSWKEVPDGHVRPPNCTTCSEFLTVPWNIIRRLVRCWKNHQQDEEAKEQVDYWENHEEDEAAANKQVDRWENKQQDEATANEQCVQPKSQIIDEEAAREQGNVQRRSRQFTFDCLCRDQIDDIIFMAEMYLWIFSHIMKRLLFYPVRHLFKFVMDASTLVMFIVGYEHDPSLRHIKKRCTWSMEVMNELLKCNSESAYEQHEMRPHTPLRATTKKGETPLLIAAKHGVVELVEGILDVCPDAIFDVNAENKNVVMLAVEHRQPHLYEFLLDDWRIMKNIFGQVDKDGNSVLHIAAKLGDGRRPWRIRGAALQMHMEVKWYKFVKHSMPPGFFARYNAKHQTSEKIFQETHRDLIEEGRQRLTNTSQSCSVVAALIATVAFATSATVPGGLRQDNGAPTLAHKTVFIVFAASSLVALSSSMISVVMFLGILTSSFRLKDFRYDLPYKLLLGLISLLVSIVSMLVSFFAGHHFVLEQELKQSATLVYALLCLLLVVFIIAMFPLDFAVVWSTFNSKPLQVI